MPADKNIQCQGDAIIQDGCRRRRLQWDQPRAPLLFAPQWATHTDTFPTPVVFLELNEVNETRAAKQRINIYHVNTLQTTLDKRNKQKKKTVVAGEEISIRDI